MDDFQFDDLIRTLVLPSRRGLLTALATAVFAALIRPGAEEARARRKKKKKVTVCHNGQTMQVSKKSRRAYLARGATLGPCPPSPSPPPPCQDAADCDDGVPCTADACAANGTCTHTPNDNLCGDNQVCDRQQDCRCRTGFRHCSLDPGHGCECATPSCCRSLCQTTHSNGVGQSFFDCVPLNTYDQTQAEKAAAAYAAVVAGSINYFTCLGSIPDTICHQTSGGTTCVCWAFDGSNEGHVKQWDCSGTFCLSASDPIWT